MEDAIACTSNNCMHAESMFRIGHKTFMHAHYAVFSAKILQLNGMQYACNNVFYLCMHNSKFLHLNIYFAWTLDYHIYTFSNIPFFIDSKL